MEEEPPQPEDSGKDNTRHKRPRTDSENSSTSTSVISTRTLQSEDFATIRENDRNYANEVYHLPCDQNEQDRLAILHQVYVHALRGQLTVTPITPSVRRILDLGTGPGEWAVAMARKYPDTEIVAIDLAVWDLEATEGGLGESRVTWEIDDLDVWAPDHELEDLTSHLGSLDPFGDHRRRGSPESSKGKGKQPHSPVEPASFDPMVLDPDAQIGWHFSEPFDFIFLRSMKGTFAYWEEVYAEIYNNLTPGGSVEIADFEFVVPEQSMSHAHAESSQQAVAESPLPNITRLYRGTMKASFKRGRPLGTFYMHPTYLEEAGFKDVRTTYVNVPVGTWPDDAEQKKIGKMWLVVFMESLEPHCLRLLTKIGDGERVWTKEEVREVVERGKQELLDWEARCQRGEVKGWCATFKWMVGRKSV